ncbi:MAG TPA: uroporphyrinogen-III synthase [Nitrosospira sp.]|nr:uroporphyrinogen-III synthase [Nitrosospira sp.]
MTDALAGINILVTRPKHQAAGLSEKIRAEGGNPVLFPVLEIQDIEDRQPLLNLIERLHEFHLAVFVSPNAVDKAMGLIAARRTPQSLPPALMMAGVGQGTVKALKKFGVESVIVPTARFDSEALLDMAELQQVEGKHVVIFRGEGGRELLGETLKKRGAVLEYVSCYRRAKPDADVIQSLKSWKKTKIGGITITSSEGLHNLFEMLGESGKAWLTATPLFVPHERIAQAARKLGVAHVILTEMGDEGLLQGLLGYFRSHGNDKPCVSAKT